MNPGKISLPLIIFVSLCSAVIAQEIQSDFFTGHNRTTLTTAFSHPVDQAQKISYSGLAFFYHYYRQDDSSLDEAGVQGGIYFNLMKNITAGTALYFNSIGGFQKKFSLLLTMPGKHFSAFLIPSLVHVEGQIMGEMMAQLSYEKSVNGQLFFLAQLQVLSSWLTFSSHARSFQQLRVGIGNKAFTGGLAVDFDQFGPAPKRNNTAGIFLRKNF